MHYLIIFQSVNVIDVKSFRAVQNENVRPHVGDKRDKNEN